MKAVRLTKIAHNLENRTVPVPKPKPKEVLVQVKAAGICRSDAHYRAHINTAAYPYIHTRPVHRIYCRRQHNTGRHLHHLPLDNGTRAGGLL